MSVREAVLPVAAEDGHGFELIARVPAHAHASLLWLPALGVAARHYVPFADAIAARGIAVFLHEWRGNGSSSLRASRSQDWGYRELLARDVPASERTVADTLPDLPRILGGHSLGGQIACCRLAMAPDDAQALWLVGSGAPYWRAFPPRERLWLPLVYRFLPWLAARRGALPGRLIGFGGSEARSLIRDWSRTALTGSYAATGVDADLEAGMAGLRLRVRAAVMAHDWLAPSGSLRFLLSKQPQADPAIRIFDDAALGARADHFAWLRQPAAVADWLAADCRPAPGQPPAQAT